MQYSFLQDLHGSFPDHCAWTTALHPLEQYIKVPSRSPRACGELSATSVSYSPLLCPRIPPTCFLPKHPSHSWKFRQRGVLRFLSRISFVSHVLTHSVQTQCPHGFRNNFSLLTFAETSLLLENTLKQNTHVPHLPARAPRGAVTCSISLKGSSSASLLVSCCSTSTARPMQK